MAHSQSSSLRIFVSYRHDDVPALSGRLADRLVNQFGEDRVFLDIDAIDPGLDFRVVLRQAIDTCDVVIVVIGPRWLEARDSDGSRRLDDPDDYVRLEVEAALDREIRIIPILADNARMPSAAELPETLVPFCYRNAVEMGRHFHTEMTALITKLERIEQNKLIGAPAPTVAPQGAQAEAMSPPQPHAGERTTYAAADETQALEAAGGRGLTRKGINFTKRTAGVAAVSLLVLAGAVGAVIALTGGGQTSQVGQGMGQSLAGLVPYFNSWKCQTARPSSREVQEQAACSPGEGAENAQLVLFKSKHAMNAAYMKRVKQANAASQSDIKSSSGHCDSTRWSGEIGWTHGGNERAGRELCYVVTGAGSYLAWTYMNANLLISARRSDDVHPLLLQWFNDHAHSIGTGASMPGPHSKDEPMQGGHTKKG
jgi:TIR domain-containing protein